MTRVFMITSIATAVYSIISAIIGLDVENCLVFFLGFFLGSTLLHYISELENV